MRKSWILGLMGLTLWTAGAAYGAMTAVGDFPINSLRPSTGTYTGGGIAFIPANTDSVAENTLVINWRIQDTVNTAKFNQIFQRITIPANSTAPTVLSTATIRWDTPIDGANTLDSTPSARVSDLVFDAASKKLVTVSGGSDGWGRFVWFDLFNSNTTVAAAQLGYSAKIPQSAASSQVKTVVATPDGKYACFYPYSTNLVSASASITGGNGVVPTTTAIAKTSFAGWYPDTSVGTTTTAGYNCEGGVAYGSSMLLIRDNKPTATSFESHLYQVGNTLDAAAINGYTDLGDVTPLGVPFSGNYINQSLMAYGLTLNGSTAFVRYGTSNDMSGGAYGRILMVNVPEPATLALLLLSSGWLIRRRR
jgi:hypothetical protein